MKVIAILGLPGSGKTEAIRYLQEKLKCPKVYFGDVTFDEMRARASTDVERTRSNKFGALAWCAMRDGTSSVPEKACGETSENVVPASNENVPERSFFSMRERDFVM